MLIYQLQFLEKVRLTFYLSPTALQRLFHYDGERAVGKAAKKFNTMFGVSALATVKCRGNILNDRYTKNVSVLFSQR